MKTLLEFYEQSGILPQALASRPLLKGENTEYLEAFNFLDASRAMYAEGLQAIAVSEVLAYCALANIPTGESAMKMLRLVQRLDTARINHWHAKQKKSAAQ